MRIASLVVAALITSQALGAEPVVGGPCEGCEAVFEGLPQSISSKSRIAPANEAGEPMLITGRVLARDGKPKANVIVYAYHTDAHGIYPRPVKSLGAASARHGRLRGWALSDDEGRYSFETIRPASYPSRDIPAHVHMHVIERGCATYYIADILFTDDPLLNPSERARHDSGRAGSGVTTPTRDPATGVWKVARDIQLGLNIPGYPGCDSSAGNKRRS
jgi:protocatechuate 3,4-dioxygenase beta subunit